MAESQGEGIQTTYGYDQLSTNEIGILVLLPGHNHEDLWGYFETVNIEDGPTYKALSYAWGDPIFPYALNLVGGRIAITTALWTALRRLRDVDYPLRLWIDAVCINQSNVKEKNPQVAMMARVFGEAREVLVWLGEEQAADCSNYHVLRVLEGWYLKWFDWRAVELHEATITTVLDAWALLQERPPSGACPCCGSCHQLHQAPLSLCVEGINAIWEAPWFKNLWVVQQAASAKNLTYIFGRHAVNFNCLRRASELAIAILQEPSSQLSSDPIDCTAVVRANATLTHISRRRNPLLSPDMVGFAHDHYYGGPLKARVSNFRLSHIFIEQYGGALLHNLVWCSELSASLSHDKIYAIRSMSGVEDDTSLRPDYAVPIDELWKRAAAHILAKNGGGGILLSLAARVFVESEDSDDAMKALPSWVPDFRRLDSTSQRRYRHSQELMHNTTEPNAFRFTIDHRDNDVVLLTGIILFTIELESHSDSRSFPQSRPQKVKTVGDISFNYSWTPNSFTITATTPKQVTPIDGMTPVTCESGDSVCLVPGCSFPLVLRHCGDDCYRLVGELYDQFAHTSIPCPTHLDRYDLLHLS